MQWLIDLLNFLFKRNKPPEEPKKEIPEVPETNTKTLCERAYEIAKKEIGVSEIEGDKDNPRILQYHQATDLKASDDETPWCSAFMNWCIQGAGGNGTKDAMARSWLKWGKVILPSSVKEGDVVVFSSPLRGPDAGHVAFYVGEGVPGFINVLGGNQLNAVKYSNYPKSLILGYRRSLDG